MQDYNLKAKFLNFCALFNVDATALLQEAQARHHVNLEAVTSEMMAELSMAFAEATQGHVLPFDALNTLVEKLDAPAILAFRASQDVESSLRRLALLKPYEVPY